MARKRTRAIDNYRKAYTDDDFRIWWEAYPRKVSKAYAYEAWKNAVEAIAEVRGIERKPAAAWLLSRTEAFARCFKGKSKEFCPYPASWLNGARFDDDPDEWGKQEFVGRVELDPERARQWRP